MPDSAAQQFLRDLDKKLWGAANRLRASLDAAVYKHAVLGLIFLKYVSDFSAPTARLHSSPGQRPGKPRHTHKPSPERAIQFVPQCSAHQRVHLWSALSGLWAGIGRHSQGVALG